jgi:opacity protein-like surface antigen
MIKVLIGVISLSLLSISYATPYIGFDSQLRHTTFRKDFGGNILESHYPQGNAFAGVMFNQNLGLEIGYEFSKKQQSLRNDLSNEVVFGKHNPITQSLFVINTVDINRASSKISGWNLNLLVSFPVITDSKLKLIGSVGMANLKLQVRNIFTRSEVEFNDPFVRDPDDTFVVSNSIYTSMKKRKAVLRLIGGAQYALTDCLSLRALVSWENTDRLQAKTVDTIRRRFPKHSRAVRTCTPRNSMQYGLGLIFTF